MDYDILLTNDYSIAGFTKTEKPVVLYTDAIFPQDYSQNVHPWLDNLFPLNVVSCQYVTKRGLDRADLCCFPTSWAVDESLKYKEAEIQKIRMIPFGANLNHLRKEIAEPCSFSRILEKKCFELLFIGRDWTLKCGEIAISVVRELRKRGINAVINVVGVMPP